MGPDGLIRTVPGTAVRLPGAEGGPIGLALGSEGRVYVAEAGNHRVRTIEPDETIHTVAGTGERGFGGDGGPATAARLHGPTGLALGPDGNLYVADTHNYRIQRIVPDGSIHTVAGNGGTTYQGRGDGGPATEAEVYQPLAVALGPDGSLYIATGHRIRKVWS